MREYLQGVADQGDLESIAELEAVQEPPHHAAHVWRWFRDLHQTRPTNGMGPCRIPRLEIRAWEQDERIRLADWERQAILRLDALWVRVTGEQLADK